jgi:hypothetical protein
MADFTITIADADVPRVLSALCQNFGYAEVSDVNALAGIMTYITNTVAQQETLAAIHAIPPIVPVDITHTVVPPP